MNPLSEARQWAWPIETVFVFMLVYLGGINSALGFRLKDEAYHVYPGDRIQHALDAAARNPSIKVIKVHAGVYRPDQAGQALIWFNRKHDGIRLEAIGPVTLTAVNRDLSDPRQPSHPALVNHVVYFGDGIGPKTVLEGFRITGANNFVITNAAEIIEPNTNLAKGLFFYCDGGAIKVFGRSYPTLRRLVIDGNYASPCAGGISVEHEGHGDGPSPGWTRIEDCIFRGNRSQVTGAALDLLPGSSALVSNCLFVANAANTGINFIDPNRDRPAFTNSAALTIFQGSRAVVSRCTFTGNRNGVDYFGEGSVFEDSLFWENTLAGGHYAEERYELDLQGHAQVRRCLVGGAVRDPHGVLDPGARERSAADPQFDSKHVPRHPDYRGVGFRPWMTRRGGLSHMKK